MSHEELESYEADLELALLREYRDVCRLFRFVVESERRFYLANEVDRRVIEADDAGSGQRRQHIEVTLRDAWVWDMYRPSRFVAEVTIVTFKDVNIERLPEAELGTP
ncbi:MAG: hypothetical protein ACI91O_000246 [Candidatus Poriferisodalaceae bacterium]|jgi:hypothetical protein